MKSFVSVILLLLSHQLYSQSYSEDFESFDSGDGIAEQSNDWTTAFGGGPRGGNTDIDVDDGDALSGAQSLRFSASGAGGRPSAVFLSLGGVRELGSLTTSFWIKIDNNDGAYFNVQGSQQNGNITSFTFQADGRGSFAVYDYDENEVGTGIYTSQTWVEVTLNVDLTGNVWEMLFDKIQIAEFQNGNNTMASICFAEINTADNTGVGFYIDDVSYKYTEYDFKDFNAQLTTVDYTGGEFVGEDAIIIAQVRNLGSFEINRMKLGYVFQDILVSQDVEGLSLVTGAYHTVTLDQPITVESGDNYVEVFVLEVEGKPDDVNSDDSKVLNIRPYVLAEGKVILLEGGTSTTCGECPIVDVTMQKVSEEMGEWVIPIEIHENDPMDVELVTDPFFDNFASSLPSVSINRSGTLTAYPESAKDQLLTYLEQEPKAIISAGAVFDEEGEQLRVQGVYAIKSEIESIGWKVTCALVESEVTSDDVTYNQRNDYWVYRGNGDFGGYESQPRIIQASNMVYRNVLRSYSPSFEGAAQIPQGRVAGDTVLVDFYFEIDESWDLKNINLIPMLISPNGPVDNAVKASLDKALEVGIKKETISSMSSYSGLTQVSVFPNPAQSTLTIKSDEAHEFSDYQIYDMRGSVVQLGSLRNTIDISTIENGLYFLALQSDRGIQKMAFSIVR